MKLYNHMFPVKTRVIIYGNCPGIVRGQLRDEKDGDQYNVFYINQQGQIKEEWIKSRDVKKDTSNGSWNASVKRTDKSSLLLASKRCQKKHSRNIDYEERDVVLNKRRILERVVDTRNLSEQQLDDLWLEYKGKGTNNESRTKEEKNIKGADE